MVASFFLTWGFSAQASHLVACAYRGQFDPSFSWGFRQLKRTTEETLQRTTWFTKKCNANFLQRKNSWRYKENNFSANWDPSLNQRKIFHIKSFQVSFFILWNCQFGLSRYRPRYGGTVDWAAWAWLKRRPLSSTLLTAWTAMTLPSPEDSMLDAHVSGTRLRAFDGPRSDRCFLILAPSYWSCCLGFVSCVRCIAWPLGLFQLYDSCDRIISQELGQCWTMWHTTSCTLALGFTPFGISLGLVHWWWQDRSMVSSFPFITSLWLVGRRRRELHAERTWHLENLRAHTWGSDLNVCNSSEHPMRMIPDLSSGDTPTHNFGDFGVNKNTKRMFWTLFLLASNFTRKTWRAKTFWIWSALDFRWSRSWMWSCGMPTTSRQLKCYLAHELIPARNGHVTCCWMDVAKSIKFSIEKLRTEKITWSKIFEENPTNSSLL